MVADAVVKLEGQGFRNRWFLGDLGSVQLRASKMMGQTLNWLGCRAGLPEQEEGSYGDVVGAAAAARRVAGIGLQRFSEVS